MLRPDPETKEFTLTALHPGRTVDEASEATGWDLKVSDGVETTGAPTDEELRVLRELRERTERARGGQRA